MSYSIFARASTKDALKEAIAAKFSDMLSHQAVHEIDKEAALAAAHTFIDLIKTEPKEDQEYIVNMNGSLGWTGADDIAGSISSANVSISTYVTAKIV